MVELTLKDGNAGGCWRRLGGRTGEVLADKAIPPIAGLGRDERLHPLGALAADHEVMHDFSAEAQGGQSILGRTPFGAFSTADGALEETVGVVEVFHLKFLHPGAGVLGELFHHRTVAGKADGVFHDAFLVTVDLRDLEALLEISESLSAARADMKRAFFKLGVEFLGDRVLRFVHGRSTG